MTNEVRGTQKNEILALVVLNYRSSMFKKLILFSLVAGVVFYVYSGYRATNRFVDALSSNNPGRIAEVIDWNSVEAIRHENARADAKSYIEKHYPQHAQSCEAWLDSVITSSGLDLRTQLFSFMERNPGGIKISSRKWNSPRELWVSFEGGYGGLFQFRGGKWVYVGTGSASKDHPYVSGEVEYKIKARCQGGISFAAPNQARRF